MKLSESTISVADKEMLAPEAVAELLKQSGRIARLPGSPGIKEIYQLHPYFSVFNLTELIIIF